MNKQRSYQRGNPRRFGVFLWVFLLWPTLSFAQVVAPKLETFVPATYPEAALAAGVEGDVILELTIEADGTVSSSRVIQSIGFGLDKAAQAATLQFVFVPASKDGTPMRATIPYRYRFSLQPTKRASSFAAPLDSGNGQPPSDIFGITDLIDTLPEGVLRGRVLERGTRSPIEAAQVVLLRPKPDSNPTDQDSNLIVKETLSDQSGAFIFEGVVPGPYEVKVLATDYEAFVTFETIPDRGILEVTLRLQPTVEQEYGLVIRGEKEEEEVTRHVVTAEELARLPGTQGDVLKGIQNLPGLARAPADIGLLVVRGSAPEDTQTFLNGMPIPLIYHFGGLTSVISGDLLNKIDFIPGVYSARYGRGMGGIIDAETRPGKNSAFHGSLDVDVFDTNAYLQGPIGKKGTTFAVAGRRSYVDVLLPLVIPDNGLSLTTAPRYWDYQASLGGSLLNGKGQVIAFGSDDSLELVVDSPEFGDQFFSTFTRFHQIQGIWSKEIAPGLTRRATIATGVTQVNFEAPPIVEFNLTTFQTAARVDWANKISDKFALSYGLDSQTNTVNVTALFPGENNTNLETESQQTVADVGVYTEGRITPFDGLNIIPGLRLDYFGGSNTPTADPRLAVRWDIDLATTIKGGAGVFHQDPQPQDLDETFGDPTLTPQVSTQIALGFERRFWKNRLSLDASVYAKRLSRLVESNGSGETRADVLGNDGLGRVYGFELLLRYPPDKRFFGWIAYSLSRAERKDFPEQESFELFNFDQTHILTMLGTYNLGADISIGARFRYATGNPETPIVGGIYDADSDFYFPIDGERNSERLPPFNQLDIRVDKTFRLPSWKFSAYLEVLNIYNRRNPEAIFYNFDFTQSQFFTGLPILPVIGVKGEF